MWTDRAETYSDGAENLCALTHESSDAVYNKSILLINAAYSVYMYANTHHSESKLIYI